MKLTRPGIITVAAHRGDSYNFCENTMPAFRSAIAAGADMIETDVHLTSDGMPVLIHDNTLDRTTNGTGPISGHTYEQLQRLNAGEPGEFLPIPRLEELLALLADTNVTLNIEIKEYAKEGNIERMRSSVDQSVALVRRYGMAGRVLFNSFDAAVLEYADSAYHGQFPLHGFYPYAARAKLLAAVEPEAALKLDHVVQLHVFPPVFSVFKALHRRGYPPAASHEFRT